MAASTTTTPTARGNTDDIAAGGGYKSAGHIYPPGTTISDLNWDAKLKTLKEFVASYRLPLVARVHSGDLSKFLPPCGPNEDNVVQIHEVRRRKIILARRLQWEKRQNDYIVSGEHVEVPASFKGWFEVAPEDGRPVEYFDTVGGICSVKPRRFLVRTSTVGYQLSIEDGVSCWMPHEIKPGEVLTTGMVYMDNTGNGGSGSKKGKGGATLNNGSNKSFFKRFLKTSKNKNRPEQDLKYLQCFDVDGKEIMIPLIMSGVFSPVGDTSMANYDAVYELQDLIMAFGLPVNAQLIHANPKEKTSCPQGVLRLYGTREEELAVLSKVEKDCLIADPAVEKVEISMDKELTLQRGLPKRRHNSQGSRPLPITNTGESVMEAKVAQIGELLPVKSGVQVEVELPKRVPKELKKSKSTGILDKLSVRKVRKERARLKELRSDDVFSSRIIRSDLSYEDFFNGLDGDEAGSEDNKEPEGSIERSSATPDKAQSASPYGKLAKAGKSPESHVEETRLTNIQDRDLPPIPIDPRPLSGRKDSTSQGSKDSLYEHLPPAPQPPLHNPSEAGGLSGDGDNEEEDGYMVPTSARGGDSAYSSSADVQLRSKQAALSQEAVRFSRLKKSRSEMLPPEFRLDAFAADGGCGISTDRDVLFEATNVKENSERPYGTMAASHWTGSTSQLYGYRSRHKRDSDTVPAWRAEVQRHQSSSSRLEGSSFARKSVDRLDLETRFGQGGQDPSTPRGQRVDPNATIRSHNLRPNKANMLELFHFSDSYRDVHDRRNCASPPTSPKPTVSSHSSPYSRQQQSPVSTSRAHQGREYPYGAVLSPSQIPDGKTGGSSPYHPHSQLYRSYPSTEPPYRKFYSRAASFSDSAYPKKGDDSAISMGSRGDNPYTLNNDSEYSYNEYTDNSGSAVLGRDDNWSPPDDVSGLSVHDVSRSLRYIGMKDRVVLRFANEQIDGSMLCSLDKRLLKEGFPELNALEIKKILDFVRGWRPKKR